MARNNSVSATFTMAAGDGAGGFSESVSASAFTSGDAIMLQGNVGTSAVEYVLANYGVAQADGVYFENRDATNYVTLSLRTASGSSNDVSTLKIAPLGVFLVRCDADQAALTHIGIQADTAACDFVLCLAE